jgi:hypothetical protein
VLALANAPVPHPAAGELLIRVAAAGHRPHLPARRAGAVSHQFVRLRGVTHDLDFIKIPIRVGVRPWKLI